MMTSTKCYCLWDIPKIRCGSSHAHNITEHAILNMRFHTKSIVEEIYTYLYLAINVAMMEVVEPILQYYIKLRVYNL